MMKTKNQNQKSSDLEINFDSIVLLNEAFDHVRFFEKKHEYTIDGEPAKCSVSSALKFYEKGFDATGVATNVARKTGKTVSEVLQEWDFKRDYACYRGTEFHKFVENFLERKKITIDEKALMTFMVENNIPMQQGFINGYYEEMAKIISHFLNFYDWWKQDHVLIKSEYVMGDRESKICGTLDNLSYNKKTKKVVIFDYKTNKEIKTKNNYKETLLAPFNKYDNCELVKYSFQIWLYRLIIERNTPIKIDGGTIVWFNAGEDNYKSFPILDVRQEAEDILDKYIHEIC